MNIFFRIWWGSLVLKIILAILVPVFPDETYYWLWSRHMQLSYFDHPPFISWLIWLSHPLENLLPAVPGLLRMPNILMSHLTLLIWYKILKNYLTKDQLVLWLVLAVTNPLFGLGSIIATPDISLLFFWAASTYFMIQVLNEPNKSSDFVFLGAMLGLGFCSKYNIVLLPFFILAWMILNKKNPFNIKTFFLMTITGLVFCLPVFIWNLNNNFDSFLFQLNHGLGKKKFSLEFPLEYVGGQLALLLPPILYFAYKVSKKSYKDIFVILSWGPLLFFLFSSFRARAEANWPIVAYPVIIALAVRYGSVVSAKWLTYTYRLWIAALLLAIPFVFLKKEIPFLKINKLTEIYDLIKVSKISDKYKPLYAANYQMASYLSYLTKQNIYKLKDMSRRDFYDYLSESTPKDNTFFLLTKPDMKLPDWANPIKHEEVEAAGMYVFLKFSKGQ